MRRAAERNRVMNPLPRQKMSPLAQRGLYPRTARVWPADMNNREICFVRHAADPIRVGPSIAKRR